MTLVCTIALCLAVLLATGCSSTPRPAGNPVVVIETSMGTIKAQLWADKAPITVANFLRYADEKFYDGLIFHRVMKGFMVQCGGFTPDMSEKPCHEPIKNEAANGVKNLKGTLAMARTPVVDSAKAQFFINTGSNAFLDHGGRDYGYAVFGQVVEGMDVVAKIEAVRTGTIRAGKVDEMEDVPLQPVIIKSIRRAAGS